MAAWAGPLGRTLGWDLWTGPLGRTALRSLGQWFGPAARANPNVGSSVERGSGILPLPESSPPDRSCASTRDRLVLFLPAEPPARPPFDDQFPQYGGDAPSIPSAEMDSAHQ